MSEPTTWQQNWPKPAKLTRQELQALRKVYRPAEVRAVQQLRRKGIGGAYFIRSGQTVPDPRVVKNLRPAKPAVSPDR